MVNLRKEDFADGNLHNRFPDLPSAGAVGIFTVTSSPTCTSLAQTDSLSHEKGISSSRQNIQSGRLNFFLIHSKF